MLPTKSNQFCQKLLMTPTYVLLLTLNHYLWMCRFRKLSINFRIINFLQKTYLQKKLLATQLKKETLKKLLIDSWSKTVFSTNNKLYQQVLVWVAPLVHFLQTLFPPAITCSKLTIERRHWRCSGVFIVNFKHISHLVLVFLLLTLSR